MTDGVTSTANNPTTWVYGDGLHLTQQVSPRGTVTYSYDGDGRRQTLGAPGLNPSNYNALYVYGYDPAGRLTSLQNPFGETTTFGYNADGTLNTKTLANGLSLVYGYDVAAQLTDLHFGSQAGAYGHHYTYTPAGELASRSESDGGTNTFSYDGADQLVSEVRTGPVPFTEGYSYDHNGNRLTMTSNGQLVQQFGYDAHDKLTGGLNESETYDANGNLLTQTLNGQTSSRTWDDEDRLTSLTLPDGHTDSFTYNGLGMRLTKNDPSGSYAYLTDGLSPASAVLTDNFSTFTPGISETNSLGSRFYLADASGNSRGLLSGSNVNTDGYNWDAFGTLISRNGSNPTMFGWNEASGYQSDNDDGLTLLGHRYYDKRTGRFINQDPAGAGTNWYAYCNNNPTNKTDPTGLYVPDPEPVTDQTVAHNEFASACYGDHEGLDNFFQKQDQQTQQGADRYAASVAASQQDSKRYYHQRIYTPGTVWNNSDYSIPIMFDHDTKNGGKIFYEMALPPHTYTGLEDIDFVFWANDPQQRGGYDWVHIIGDTNTIITNSGSGGAVAITGLFFPGTFKGYPYNVTPLPVSGNVSIQIYSIPKPAIPPFFMGPIP